MSGRSQRALCSATWAIPGRTAGAAEHPLDPHLHFGLRAGQRADYPQRGEWRWMAGWIRLCPRIWGGCSPRGSSPLAPSPTRDTPLPIRASWSAGAWRCLITLGLLGGRDRTARHRPPKEEARLLAAPGPPDHPGRDRTARQRDVEDAGAAGGRGDAACHRRLPNSSPRARSQKDPRPAGPRVLSDSGLTFAGQPRSCPNSSPGPLPPPGG